MLPGTSTVTGSALCYLTCSVSTPLAHCGPSTLRSHSQELRTIEFRVIHHVMIIAIVLLYIIFYYSSMFYVQFYVHVD